MQPPGFANSQGCMIAPTDEYRLAGGDNVQFTRIGGNQFFPISVSAISIVRLVFGSGDKERPAAFNVHARVTFVGTAIKLRGSD
ncbi:hypothetical protein J2R96_002120 [Bradyrhizobium elkanii]|nr:hypothetical protein [Bradyrhizobium elkanii]